MITSIGLLEFSSIAAGYESEDSMLKAGAVNLVIARTICSGKFLVIVSGDVDAVKASVEAGKTTGEGFVVDELVLPYVHPSVLPALGGAIDLKDHEKDAMGIIETFSASTAIQAADAACKAASVILFRLHLAMAIGGKGFLCLTGDVASVKSAILDALEVIKEKGLLTGYSIIPRPREELFNDLL